MILNYFHLVLSDLCIFLSALTYVLELRIRKANGDDKHRDGDDDDTDDNHDYDGKVRKDGDDIRDALFVDRVVAVLHSVQVFLYLHTSFDVFIKKQIKIKLQF